MPYKHFECPHCAGPVHVELEDLHAASAAPECTACGRVVYVTAGKMSNYQPGLKPGETGAASPSYDSGD
jgi:predicted RNA-binding Zn-ribbon protein involved in translation (DUF1610 family)